jgi:hypothetical protein
MSRLRVVEWIWKVFDEVVLSGKSGSFPQSDGLEESGLRTDLAPIE